MSGLRSAGGRLGALLPAGARRPLAAAGGIGLALAALPFLLRLDGRQHAGIFQFAGRFHPLAVHLPIGLLVLLPVLEIAGRRRPALREAGELVLRLAAASALFALLLGYLLAWSSGDTGALLTRHMWGGIALTILLVLCVVARPGWRTGVVPRVYPALLGCSLLALVWTAHQGGSLTHGANYLTQFMPAPLNRWLAPSVVEANAAAAGSFYAKHIDPILDAKCVSCHGEGKREGGLRLDSYAQLMRGGKDGAVVVAGQAERSLIYERITLPAGDKHLMPAEGRPPLKAEEIEWIRAWIEQGASPRTASLKGISIREREPEPAPQPVGDYSSLAAEILAMQQGQGAKLLPVSSKPSDGLILSTVDAPGAFGDAQLASMARFAPYIVEAELGRTAVTDACFDTLAKFTHLRALHLEGTGVTGEGIGKLSPLTQLTYINLSGSRVTHAASAQLEAIKSLRHVYLFNTPAEPEIAGNTPETEKKAQ